MNDMNELQIVEQIFGSDCFCPHLKVVGDRQYISARAKLKYFNDWNYGSVSWYMEKARRFGYGLGVDFDTKSFTLHKI